MAAPELERPVRHSLVWLQPEAPWRVLEPAARERLAGWFASGWPAVLARCQGDEPPGHWRLGVPLPPAEGKRRLGLTVPPAAIASWRPPPALRETLDAAPADWQAAVQCLLVRAAALGIEPRVYGSFAWQALTGLVYVTPGSDLDLAWQPRSQEQLRALFSALQDWEAETGRRADGEVLLPGGAGVCWRELASEAPRVLVKTAAAVALRPRQEIVAALTHGYRERAT